MVVIAAVASVGVPPIGWARQNATPLKFDPKLSEVAFSAVLPASINVNRN